MLVENLNPSGGDLVYIHLFDVDDPYVPPEEYRPQNDYEGRFERDSFAFTAAEIVAGNITPAETAQLQRLYEGEARVVDDYLGRILDIFEARNLWDNTALVFNGDHGEEFAEHGDYLHGGLNLHPELTHVPLVVYWPERLEGGRRVAAPVSLCDLHPTVLEALGLDYDPDLLNGVSLLDDPDPDRAVTPSAATTCPASPPTPTGSSVGSSPAPTPGCSSIATPERRPSCISTITPGPTTSPPSIPPRPRGWPNR